MTPVIVVDVNIFASALVSGNGAPSRVLRLGLAQRVHLVLSLHIIETLQRVLTKPYFLARTDEQGRSDFLYLLAAQSLLVEPDNSVRNIAPDLEDDLVRGTAVAANADYLITGDKGLLAIGEYHGVRIVTAEAFLGELEQDYWRCTGPLLCVLLRMTSAKDVLRDVTTERHGATSIKVGHRSPAPAGRRHMQSRSYRA